MNIDAVLFLLTSFLVVIDFGIAGVFLYRLSREAKPDERTFISGIAYLLMTVAVFNLFWIILVSFGSQLQLSENPVLRHFVTGLIIAIDVGSIIGRWRWWRQIIPVVKNGHHTNKEIPPNAP